METVPARPSPTEEERRTKRASWVVRRFRLGEEPSDDLSATTSVEERMAMMWPLAVDAFSHRADSKERTPRETWPVRLRKLGDPEVD